MWDRRLRSEGDGPWERSKGNRTKNEEREKEQKNGCDARGNARKAISESEGSDRTEILERRTPAAICKARCDRDGRIIASESRNVEPAESDRPKELGRCRSRSTVSSATDL